MRSAAVLFVLAFVVWCVFCWPPDAPSLVAGVLAAALVAYLAGDLFVQRPHLMHNPVRYWYFCFFYLPVVFWECLKANLDVAYRVVHPALPIHPGIVRVKTGLKSDTALTFLANSITLTPGTMSVDVDKDKGIIYVHWIEVKTTETQAATKRIAGRFEYILEKIFE